MPELNRIYVGDALQTMRQWPDAFVHCVVTSPPYWGLRDYGVPGQMGLERTPEEYVAKMVEVFREVRRILRPDGTLWLNMGDCYASAGGTGNQGKHGDRHNRTHTQRALKRRVTRPKGTVQEDSLRADEAGRLTHGLKPKDLVGMPWRLAFALQADGWYLRSDIIWAKPNPMPESVTDRPTKAHEYIFLLAKSERYFYDAEAIRETATRDWANTGGSLLNNTGWHKDARGVDTSRNCERGINVDTTTRNKRTVWTIPTEAFAEAHFATFPQALVEPCIMAGTSEAGACAECGAPVARVFEKDSAAGQRRPAGSDTAAGSHGKSRRGRYSGKWATQDAQASGTRILARVKEAREAGGDHDNPFPPKRTIGWKPSCRCRKDFETWGGIKVSMPTATGPCVVFDPFMGAGTTGLVAARYNRDFIGCELNPEYAAMAERRIAPERAQMKLL